MMNPWAMGGAAVAALLLVATVYGFGRSAGADSVQADWDAAELAHQKKVAELTAAHRQKEQSWQAKTNEVANELSGKLEQVQASMDATLADVRGDNLRLRKRFQSCERRVSDSPSPAGGSDEASESGLSRADEELVIRIAAEADQCAVRLTALQDYARALK